MVVTCSHHMGMVSSCKLTPPKRLSISHWKALGDSYLLSHKSNSGGGGGGSMKELWPLEVTQWSSCAYTLLYASYCKLPGCSTANVRRKVEKQYLLTTFMDMVLGLYSHT